MNNLQDTKNSQTERPVDCERCNRLEDALKRANGLAEHFERAWYLRGDEIERLTAQSEQEPVAWFSPLGNLYKTRFHATANGEQVITPLYTTPQRTWVGLTDEQKVALCKKFPDHLTFNSIEATEAKLKENNNSLQPELEHNFCPRCGKRNKDIHTCTPPQD